MLSQLLLLLPLVLAGDEFANRQKDASDDIEKLWELALWCEAQEREDDARATLARILVLDAEHAGAHEKLRHHRYDEKWFETYRALSTYRRAEDARMAEKGLVRHGDGWVGQEALPFVRMNWVKDDRGNWISPAVLAKREADTRLAAEGWEQQDLTWIHPDDFEPWRAGLWKCGEEWLDTAAADAFHAEINRWWEVPGDHFVTRSTCDRESLRWITWWADQTYQDLVRATGMHPAEKPRLMVLNSLEQYNDFAAGNAGKQRPAAEAAGWSSVHYAFLAESWVSFAGATPEYDGGGACYWATEDETLTPFGQHAVRHAAAQSFLEAIDPSWTAVSEMVTQPPGTPMDTTAFWEEKALPGWFRYGVASYVERYFRDASAGEDGDPLWARKWATDNLRNQGGLRDLQEIFAFGLDTNDPENSSRLISEAGLLVAFILDGECRPVQEQHRALKMALKSGGDADADGDGRRGRVAGGRGITGRETHPGPRPRQNRQSFVAAQSRCPQGRIGTD